MSDIVIELRGWPGTPMRACCTMMEAADEIERLRAENNHLRSVGMGRPSAELHEAAMAELRSENERLRARVKVLERVRAATIERSVSGCRASIYELERALRDSEP